MSMRRFLFIIFLFVLSAGIALAQDGEIQGKVTDKTTGEPLPFVNVAVTVNGNLRGAQTDFDGFYTIKPVPPGSYQIEFSYVGMQSQIIEGVLVTSDKITFLDVQLAEESELLDIVEVKSYKVPLLKADETSTGSTKTKEDIANLPTRNVNTIAATAGGVYQADDGASLNVKGSRSNATDYYIDGIKVRGTSALPASAIEQLTVVTGGVPARYGDATGGIINITTRGPSSEFAGGVELITSKFLDPYGYYLGNLSLSGPLLKKKLGETGERTILGFFISGEFQHHDDDDPSAHPYWTVKESVKNDIIAAPLVPSEISATGFEKKVDHVTKENLEKSKIRPVHTSRNVINAAGKIDFQPVSNLNFTIGGNTNIRRGGTFGSGNNLTFNMFNTQHLPDIQTNVYRGYVRFLQRFGGNKVAAATDEEGEENRKSSLFQNAYYQIQFDYTKENNLYQDPVYKDDLLKYGYVGKFQTQKAPQYVQDSIGNIYGWELSGYQDTSVLFTPSDINEARSNHNQQIIDINAANDVFFSNPLEILLNGGYLNGIIPSSQSSAYSIYTSPGETYNLYNTFDRDQYRVTFRSAFDIKKAGASDRKQTRS